MNLGFLGFFKYYNFFLENFVDAFSVCGMEINTFSLNIILPVGISFYTFQTLRYTIDVYNRKLEPSNVNIADANFKAYLVRNTAVNTNGDNEIQVSEATPFAGSINCSNLGSYDLTGIEAFTALTNLNYEQNQLASLDVRTNTALNSLICNTNQLTSLDVSTTINISISQLLTLTFSNHLLSIE